MTPEQLDEIEKRLLDSCNGHPFAKIPWPHRILHEAAKAIKELRSQIPPPPTLRDKVRSIIVDCRCEVMAEMLGNFKRSGIEACDQITDEIMKLVDEQIAQAIRSDND